MIVTRQLKPPNILEGCVDNLQRLRNVHIISLFLRRADVAMAHSASNSEVCAPKSTLRNHLQIIQSYLLNTPQHLVLIKSSMLPRSVTNWATSYLKLAVLTAPHVALLSNSTAGQ